MGRAILSRDSWREKKSIVGDYLSIDANRLAYSKILKPGYDCFIITWNLSGKEIGSCGLEIDISETAYAVFHYTERHIRIDLSWYAPGYGGHRYLFHCPVCGNRVRILYFKGDLACRICHNLTYRSCQEGHEFDRLYKRMAEGERFSWHYVKWFINYCIRENAKRPKRPRGRPRKNLIM